jgi:virginiamycin A acetyltransferase
VNKKRIRNSVSRPDPDRIYPRTDDKTICYLKNVVKSPNITVGDFTIYHDFRDPTTFERESVLYHYPINKDKLIIGKFCSIACGAKFIMNGANHKLASFNNYPFPIFSEEWESHQMASEAWDNNGDIIIGNDVWIGFEALVLAGVRIGDGAIIAARSVVNGDVPPFSIVGGVPARIIRNRFSDQVIELLQDIKWWDWDMQKIKESIPALCSGDISLLEKLAEGL